MWTDDLLTEQKKKKEKCIYSHSTLNRNMICGLLARWNVLSHLCIIRLIIL